LWYLWYIIWNLLTHERSILCNLWLSYWHIMVGKIILLSLHSLCMVVLYCLEFMIVVMPGWVIGGSPILNLWISFTWHFFNFQTFRMVLPPLLLFRAPTHIKYSYKELILSYMVLVYVKAWVNAGLIELVPHRYIAWYAIFDGDWLGPLRKFGGPLDYIFDGPLMREVIDHLILALVLNRQAFGYRMIMLFVMGYKYKVNIMKYYV